MRPHHLVEVAGLVPAIFASLPNTYTDGSEALSTSQPRKWGDHPPRPAQHHRIADHP
jgi:hypothetical protein